ncbi:MAG: glycosyltransferase family 2 protein [Porphyromonas sp.]|nr:glycosyltransferase family 2 protein [Porphyromonas sp.]
MERSSKPVAVVILNWNGAEMLREFLPPLLENTCADLADIVVADNGSQDSSLQLLQEHFPSVRILDLERNWGFAEGYNRAIEQVANPYVLLLNSDVEVSSGWLEPLYDLISQDADIVAVQPKIRSYREKSAFEYAGAAGGYLDLFGYPFCRGRIFDTVEKDSGQYDTREQVFWTTGAAMLVRRNAFLSMGGFDSWFFAHQEEIDLCWRWIGAGYKLYCEPRSVVYHVGGASLSAENPFKTFLNFRNNLLMLKKNLPAGKRRVVLPLRLILDTLAASVFFLSGKRKDAGAVFRAWIAFLKMKPTACRVLTSEEKKRAYDKLYSSSLLLAYHLYRKQKYSDLKT